MKLADHMRQVAAAEAAMSEWVCRTMPAHPKPHLYKLEGVWYCTRHLWQDEFFRSCGTSPATAFAGGEVSIDTETLMRDAPTWMDDHA
jgi:hypothetical protein